MRLHCRSILKQKINKYSQQKVFTIYICYVFKEKSNILSKKLKTKGEGWQKKEI